MTCSYGGDVSIKVMQGVFPNRERGYAGKLPCYEWIRYRMLYSDLNLIALTPPYVMLVEKRILNS